MKFNEKLIELRRNAGLSQEELGNKLNVTRQTISKWELSQTTPEIDKLVEMSKLFNISVDELIKETAVITNSNTTIKEKTVKNESSRNNIIMVIMVGLLILVLVLIAIKAYSLITTKWKEEQEKIVAEKQREQEREDKFYDTLFDAFDNINQTTEVDNIIPDKMAINIFNGSIEMYNGTRKGAHVASLLDNIITSNKKEERKITVKFMDTETQNEDEIKNIKRKIGTFDDCEVTFEYDEDGYINKVIIEKL